MGVLTKLDLFGIPFQLRILGKDKFTTTLGGLLTLATLCVSAVIFYFMGTDLWYRRNPNVVPNEVTHEDALYTDLSKGEYPFMLRLAFFDGFNTPNKGYKLLAEYLDFEENATGGYDLVCHSFFNNLVNCNEHSVKKLDRYKDQDLSSWLCLDFKVVEAECKAQTNNHGYKVELGGALGDITFKFLRISVVNYTFDQERKIKYIAKEAELYDEKETKFLIRYPKHIFNSQLEKNALKTTFEEEDHPLHKGTLKGQQKYFKSVTLYDDLGWVSEAIGKTHSIEKDKETTDFYSSNVWQSDMRMFYQTVISLNHKEHQYHRRYLKLQDVLALSASIMKGVASACYLFATFIGQSKVDRELFDELFQVEDQRQHSENEEIKANSIVTTSAIAKKEHEVAEPGFFSRCLSWCRTKVTAKVSREVLERAGEIIRQRIEVSSIVRVFDDLEKLKLLLLTDEQMYKLDQDKKLKLN